MHKIFRLFTIVICAVALYPSPATATAPKTLTGVVTKIYAGQITFTTTSAATYTAETVGASLVRKNGAAMQISEILVGDKLQVTGQVWNDNSISASLVQDNSLYAHTGTFSGKIISISPSDFSFVLQSKAHGSQTIHTNTLTAFSKNGSGAGFNTLALGMTATVKGMWDRNNSNILATSVAASFRLINIYFTGSLSMQNGSSLTIIGNGNVIYGVDINGASLQNKNGLPIVAGQLKIGDTLRVWGKHISGSVQISATKVKDSSITK